jgi:hypothetical protein
MKRLFIFVVGTTEAEYYFSTNRRSLVPEDVRRPTDAISIARASAVTDIDAFFRSKVLGFINEYESIFIFYEEGLEQFLSNYKMIFFLAQYRFTEPRIFLNVIRSIISAVVRRANLILEKMQNHVALQIILLPRRNFVSHEANAIWEFLTVIDQDGAEREGLERRISGLMKARRKPKKIRKSGKRRFFVDEKGWHFEYGMEHHGSPEIGDPKHLITCALASIFRFSVRYDNQRHYNVTLDGKQFSGELDNCHDTKIGVRNASHVNIWPNDYLVPKYD